VALARFPVSFFAKASSNSQRNMGRGDATRFGRERSGRNPYRCCRRPGPQDLYISARVAADSLSPRELTPAKAGK